MSPKLTNEKTESITHEIFCNLIAMVEEGRCTVEEAREELETNPSAFIEKLRKGI